MNASRTGQAPIPYIFPSVISPQGARVARFVEKWSLFIFVAHRHGRTACETTVGKKVPTLGQRLPFTIFLRQLRGLPPVLHWFCERTDDGASREETSEPCTEKKQPAIKLEGSTNEIHANIKVEDVKSHSVKLEDVNSVKIKLEEADSGYPTVDDRRRLVTDSLQLFAYNGVDVLPHQAYLKEQIDRQLGKCDICILEYHKAKYRAIQSLRR